MGATACGRLEGRLLKLALTDPADPGAATLGHVDEASRLAHRADRELAQAGVDVADRAELLIGHFDAQIHFAAVPDINNRTIRRTVRQQMAGSDQQTAHFVDRFLSRAQANALQFIPGQVIEPLEGQR